MTDTGSTHLSDDALDDLLLGECNASAEAHLAGCPVCTARLESFQSTVALFNQASWAWSDARSNTISRELPAPKRSFAILPAWSVAAAFFLAVALSFLVGIHRGMSPRNAEQAQSSIRNRAESTNRQQEIASDNAMLDAIASEISHPVPSPLDVYSVGRTNAQASRGNTVREVSD